MQYKLYDVTGKYYLTLTIEENKDTGNGPRTDNTYNSIIKTNIVYGILAYVGIDNTNYLYRSNIIYLTAEKDNLLFYTNTPSGGFGPKGTLFEFIAIGGESSGLFMGSMRATAPVIYPPNETIFTLIHDNKVFQVKSFAAYQ